MALLEVLLLESPHKLPLLTPSQSMEETFLFFYIFVDDLFEHPSIPFLVSKKEVNVPFKDYFMTITLEKKLDAMTTVEIFYQGTYFSAIDKNINEHLLIGT